MNPLLRLYPKDWRERHGDELSEILADRPPSPADALDLVLGALDAHLRAPRPWQRSSGTEVPMSTRLGPAGIASLAAILGGVMWIAAVVLAALIRGQDGGPWVALLAAASILLLVALVGFATTPTGRGRRLSWAAVLLPTIGLVLAVAGITAQLLVGDRPIIGVDVATDETTGLLIGGTLFGLAWIVVGLPAYRRPAMGPLAQAVVGGLLIVALQAGAVAAQSPTALVASATLNDEAGTEVGTVTWTQTDAGVTVTASVTGLTPGFHGFHVHATGECVAPFTSAGGHLNPASAAHGAHMGDMPTLTVNADGTGGATFLTDRYTVADVLGKAAIVHAGPDNLANIPERYLAPAPSADPSADPMPLIAGPDAATLGAGDSGPRIACGVIEPVP